MKKYFTLFFAAILMVACNNDDDGNFVRIENNVLQYTTEGGEESFSIYSNTSWRIENKDSVWITLSKKEGTGDAVINVTVKENETHENRSSIIKITFGNNQFLEVSVSQNRTPKTVALFILSEGFKTSEIAYYNIKSKELTKNYYTLKNNEEAVGSTGNDLVMYGSKLYCVVSGSSESPGYLNVIDPETGKSVKKIDIKDKAGNISTPRAIIFNKNKAFLSTYSNTVVRVDTALLVVDAIADLSGTYAEGLSICDEKIYVCNSGQGADSTISVVDIKTFKELRKITVPKNPASIVTSQTGELYFSTADLSWAGGAESNLYVLDPKTEKITHTFNIRASRLATIKDDVYSVCYDWNDSKNYLYKINTGTKATSAFTAAGIDKAYNVSANQLNGDVYISDMGETIIALDKNGNKIFDLKTGGIYMNKVAAYWK